MTYIPGTVNTQYVNRYANRASLNAANFNLTASESVILDLDSYVSNKTIQVSTYSTGLTAQISLDGINFFPSIVLSAVGVYSFPLPFRYVQLTAAGDCSGVVIGTLSGGSSSSGGGGGGDVTSVNGQTGSVNLSTDDIPEGSTNLYFTNARAESAVVVQTISSGDTTHASSSNALYVALEGKQPTGTYITAVTGVSPVASSGGTTPAISMSVANSTTNGYLTSTDWNTFNNKQPAGSYVLTSREINTSSPLSGGGSLVSDLTLSISEANTSTSGYISSTDWNTFNNKQPAGSYITSLTGDVVASGPGVASSTIQSNVVSNSKLAQMPTLTIKGNNTGSTANALDLTVAQVNTMLGNISSIGTIDSQVASLNGLVINGSSLYTQSASTSDPGMVNITTQTFAGNKTFTGQTTISNSSTDALIINSTSFVFDATNNSFGIGIQPSTSATIDIINNSGSPKYLQQTSYSGGVGLRGRYANGTLSAPTNATAGQVLTYISGRGYGTTGFTAATTGSINIIAGESFSDSSAETYLTFTATPTGAISASEHMRIAATGITLGPQSSSTDLHTINGGWIRTTKTITSTYTIDTTTTDDIILCNQSTSINIQLPVPTVGRTIVIKDITGNAQSNTITLLQHASETIEGLNSSKVLYTNYGSWTFSVGSAGNWWMI